MGKFSADIAGFIVDKESGKYTGFITSEGYTIQVKDSDGNIVPLNKEAVERFMRENNK